MTQHYLSEFVFPRLQLQSAQLDSNLPMTSNALAIWIEQLPVFNSRTVASSISDYLIQINSLNLDEGERFEILELLRPTVAYLITTMLRQGRGREVETTHDNRARQYAASVILRNMALGYQRLLVYATQSSWLGSSNKARALLVERILFYSSEQLRLSYMMCAFEHKDVWQALNISYHYAVTEQIAERKVKDPLAFHSGKGRLDLIYKRAVVLAMASPYNLRDAEIEQIHEGLAETAAILKIQQLTKPNSKMAHVVDLSASFPPHLQAEVNAKNNACYWINSKDLYLRLNDWLHAEKKIKGEKITGLPRYLLQHLCRHLKPVKHRAQKRILTERVHINVVIGFNHIYQLVTQADVEATLDTQKEEKKDSVRFTQVDRPRKDELKSRDELIEIPKYRFNVENESKTGAELSYRDAQTSKLHVGQSILLESVDSDRWLLADVCWMRLKSELELRLGVQLIGTDLEGVEVSEVMDPESASAAVGSQQVIALKSMAHTDTLLLPGAKYEKGDRVLLTWGESETTVVLNERIWENRTLTQFSYSEFVEIEQVETEEQDSLPLLA